MSKFGSSDPGALQLHGFFALLTALVFIIGGVLALYRNLRGARTAWGIIEPVLMIALGALIIAFGVVRSVG